MVYSQALDYREHIRVIVDSGTLDEVLELSRQRATPRKSRKRKKRGGEQNQHRSLHDRIESEADFLLRTRRSTSKD